MDDPVEFDLLPSVDYGKDELSENVVALHRVIAAGLKDHNDACESIAAAIADEMRQRYGSETGEFSINADAAADCIVAALRGKGFVPFDPDLKCDLEDAVGLTNLFGPGVARNFSLQTVADAKHYAAQCVANQLRVMPILPSTHTIAGQYVQYVDTLVKRHNDYCVAKEAKWSRPKDHMNGYVAAIMCAAEHSRPDHGQLLMEIAADKPTGSASEERVGNGILRWFDPAAHKWVLAELPDGKYVSGPIRDMFNAYWPGGSERDFETFRVNLRRFVDEVDVGAMLRSGAIDPCWSLVNGGSMAWHRRTYELKPLVGDPEELAYKGTCIGAFMTDDGTGHAVRVEPPFYDVVTAGGEHKQWSAERDFFPAMFPGQEEAGTDAMRQVISYWTSRTMSNREVPFPYGVAKGGKSCLIRALQNLCGGNFASVSLGDFSKNKALTTIAGKYAIIGEDNAPNERMTGDGTKTFKNVADQGVFSCDPLFKERVLMRFTGAIIEAGNTLTRTDDRTGAVASRIVPIEVRHSFEGDPDRVPDVIERIVYDNSFLVWLAQWGADGCNGAFAEFDASNPIIADSKQQFEDTSDWVRTFMRRHVEALDEAGVDCELVPALYEAFKADYSKHVSGHGNTVSFDRDFRTSLVRIADELGFTIALDKNEQFLPSKPRRGFYEPEVMYDLYRHDTAQVRTDIETGRVVWRNADLMRWTDPTELNDNPVTGRKGLLSRNVRGVMYRKSALERFEREGVTPAQERARIRAERHRVAWEAASDDDRLNYDFFVRDILDREGFDKVGPDFFAFGVNDEGAARATVYAHRDTGFDYVVPTIDEWIRQRRPCWVKHPDPRYTLRPDAFGRALVCTLCLTKDPRQVHYLINDSHDNYSDEHIPLESNGTAPASTNAPTNVSSSSKAPAQATDATSAPADGACGASVATAKPAPANSPSAGSEAGPRGSIEDLLANMFAKSASDPVPSDSAPSDPVPYRTPAKPWIPWGERSTVTISKQ